MFGSGSELTSKETAGATERAEAQGFPVRAWIALVVMLASVAVAGYAMFSRFSSPVMHSRDLVELAPARGAVWGQPRVQPDGVRETGNNSYEVKAGEARLRITQRANGERNFNFSYNKPDLISPEQAAALTARFRLPRDPAFAKALEVTPEQLKQLQALPGRDGMAVTDGDRERMAGLFDAYLQAPPPRRSETAALVKALGEIGDKNLEPTRALLAERAAQVQKTLTPAQIGKFMNPGN
jgi:hypothetical protein